MNNHRLRELAQQAGFNVNSDGNLSLYSGVSSLILRPNYQGTVADGIKLLVKFAIEEERKMCAQLCKEIAKKSSDATFPKAVECADAILARKTKDTL